MPAIPNCYYGNITNLCGIDINNSLLIAEPSNSSIEVVCDPNCHYGGPKVKDKKLCLNSGNYSLYILKNDKKWFVETLEVNANGSVVKKDLTFRCNKTTNNTNNTNSTENREVSTDNKNRSINNKKLSTYNKISNIVVPVTNNNQNQYYIPALYSIQANPTNSMSFSETYESKQEMQKQSTQDIVTIEENNNWIWILPIIIFLVSFILAKNL